MITQTFLIVDEKNMNYSMYSIYYNWHLDFYTQQSLQWYHLPAQRTTSHFYPFKDSKEIDYYIDKLAQQEVEEALKEYEITTEVSSS